MLKKVSGKKITKEQIEKVKVRGGELFFGFYETDLCKAYCAGHCGDKEGSTKNLASGQDYYQS